MNRTLSRRWTQGIGRLEAVWAAGESAANWRLPEVAPGDIPAFTAVYLPGPDNLGHSDGRHEVSSPNEQQRLVEGNMRPFQHFLGHTVDEIGRFDALVREQGMQHATIYLFTSDHGQTVTANERDDELASDPDGDGEFIPYDGSVHGRYEVEGHPDGTHEEPFRVKQLLHVFNAAPGVALDDQLFLSDEADSQAAGIMGNSTQHLRRSIIFSPNGGLAYVYIRAPGDRNVAEHPDTWRMPDFASIRDIAVTLIQASQDGSSIGYPEFTGVLGDPAVILVRENSAIPNAPDSFEYKWLRIVNDLPSFEPLSRLAAAHPHWEMLEQRIRQIDDKEKAGGVANTRCGDIIMIMNTAAGYNAVHEADAYPGWHGGPSKADSIVPFALAYPGIHLQGNSWLSELPTTLGRGGTLRNRHMTNAVRAILERVRQ